MRVTVQFVPAQKASCAFDSAKPSAADTPIAAVAKSALRCTRYSGPEYALYSALTMLCAVATGVQT